jgi:Phosphopantetheine attachment site.
MPDMAPDTELILSCIRKSLPPGTELSLEKSFGELGIDSLRLSQITVEIEDTLGLTLEDSDIEGILTSSTLRDVVRQVEDRVRKRS